jgi:hypothetical protein
MGVSEEGVGKHEGDEGYLWVGSVGAGATGEAPAMGAVSGGARRSVRRRSDEGGRR